MSYSFIFLNDSPLGYIAIIIFFIIVAAIMNKIFDTLTTPSITLEELNSKRINITGFEQSEAEKTRRAKRKYSTNGNYKFKPDLSNNDYGNENLDRSGVSLYNNITHQTAAAKYMGTVNAIVYMTYGAALETLYDCDRRKLALITHDVVKELINKPIDWLDDTNTFMEALFYSVRLDMQKYTYVRKIDVPQSPEIGQPSIDFILTQKKYLLEQLLVQDEDIMFYMGEARKTAKHDIKRFQYELEKYFADCQKMDIYRFPKDVCAVIVIKCLQKVLSIYHEDISADSVGFLLRVFCAIFNLDKDAIMKLIESNFNIRSAESELSQPDLKEIEEAYAVLGCSDSDDLDTIIRKKRHLLNTWHPDKANPNDVEYYTKKSQEINEAFDVIRNYRS